MHMSINELYGDLLIKKREIEKSLINGKAICLHCQCTKEKHLHDGRCSVCATSRTFKDSQHADAERIDKAINLIEELQAI